MALLQSGKSRTRPGGANKHLTMYTSGGRFIARKKGRPRGIPKDVIKLFRLKWLECVRYMVRYYDPRMQKAVRDATEGTQILWDDFLTMSIAGTCYGAIEIDGNLYYPLAVKVRVSEALDAITNKQGFMMARGEDIYVGIPYGTSGTVLTSNGPNVPPSWA